MIHYRPDEDLFKAEVEALVNPVNCVGVMGAGLALQFKKTYPQYFDAYLTEYRKRRLRIGSCSLYKTSGKDIPAYIISFPTKFHWKDHSMIPFVRSGLEDLVRIIKNRGIRSIAVPMLGCGLGGLDWNNVRPLIEQALGGLEDCDVYVYGPGRDADPGMDGCLA